MSKNSLPIHKARLYYERLRGIEELAAALGAKEAAKRLDMSVLRVSQMEKKFQYISAADSVHLRRMPDWRLTNDELARRQIEADGLST